MTPPDSRVPMIFNSNVSQTAGNLEIARVPIPMQTGYVDPIANEATGECLLPCTSESPGLNNENPNADKVLNRRRSSLIPVPKLCPKKRVVIKVPRNSKSCVVTKSGRTIKKPARYSS